MLDPVVLKCGNECGNEYNFHSLWFHFRPKIVLILNYCARIVILRTDNNFYTIRNLIEISGLLTVGRNADHLIQITNDPRIYYTVQGLSRRSEIALRDILN